MFPTIHRFNRHVRLFLVKRRSRLGPETGASTVEVLSWAAVSVVAIVVIGAALQTLGVDVITYVRHQIGV